MVCSSVMLVLYVYIMHALTIILSPRCQSNGTNVAGGGFCL